MTVQLDQRIKDLGEVDDATAEAVSARARASLTTHLAVPRRTRRRRARHLVVAVAGIVIALVALLASVHPWSGNRAEAAVLRRALVAVTAPPHTIQHIVQVLHQGSLVLRTDSWQSMDDPAASRWLQVSSDCGPWVNEISSSLTGQQWYDADHDRILRVRRDPVKVRAAWPIYGPRTEFDPTVPFTVALQRGEARVVGERVYRGLPVTLISWPEDPASDPDGTARNSLYVNTATGAPVVYFWGGGRLDGTGGVVAQQRFLTYEFLPDDGPAERQLAARSTHPGAALPPVMSQAAFDAARQDAQRVHCGGVG